MWTAIAVVITIVVLGGGFGLLLMKTNRKLGEANAKIKSLEEQLAWYKRSLRSRAGSDPTLDDLARVFKAPEGSPVGPE